MLCQLKITNFQKLVEELHKIRNCSPPTGVSVATCSSRQRKDKYFVYYFSGALANSGQRDTSASLFAKHFYGRTQATRDNVFAQNEFLTRRTGAKLFAPQSANLCTRRLHGNLAPDCVVIIFSQCSERQIIPARNMSDIHLHCFKADQTKNNMPTIHTKRICECFRRFK